VDPADETFREYERVVDPNYLEQIRTEAKQFSTKLLSRQSGVAECAIRKFKNGRNTIKPGFEKMLVLYLPVSSGVEIVRVIHGSRDLVAFLRRERR
jgi:hypothetical protein